VTDWTTSESEFDSWHFKKIFFPSKCPAQLWSSHSLLFSGYGDVLRYTACCSVGMGTFSGTQPAVQWVWGRSPVHSPWVVKLNTHIHPLLRTEYVELYLHYPNVVMAWRPFLYTSLWSTIHKSRRITASYM